MNATLKPQYQAQPETSPYGPQVLELFPRLTRATFLALFGEEAPPYDPARRIQRFFDSSADTSAGLDAPYKIERYIKNSNQVYELRTFTITVREALTPNLPGAYSYPKYQTPPSRVFYNLQDENGQNIGKNFVPDQTIATEKATRELIAELLSTGVLIEPVNFRIRPDDLHTHYEAEPGEARRIYEIGYGSKWLNVGLLLLSRNANGVGAPGIWTATEEELKWTSTISNTGEFDPRPEIPMPQRRLFPDEEWRINPFGDFLVRKTADAPPESGDTPKMLAEILKRVTQLQRDLASKK